MIEHSPIDRLLYLGVLAALALTLVCPFLILSSSDVLASLLLVSGAFIVVEGTAFAIDWRGFASRAWRNNRGIFEWRWVVRFLAVCLACIGVICVAVAIRHLAG